MKWTLYRYDQGEDNTLGILMDEEGSYLCDTLECPWKDNKPKISCIAEGEYKIRSYVSPSRREKCILIHDVEGRSGIEIHEANQVSEISGCIAVGIKSIELVLRSREKLGILLALLGNEVGTLIITRI